MNQADLRTQADQWFEKQQLLNEEQSMGSQAQKMAAGMLSTVLLTTIAPEADAAPKFAIGRCQVAQKSIEESLYPVDVSGC